MNLISSFSSNIQNLSKNYNNFWNNICNYRKGSLIWLISISSTIWIDLLNHVFLFLKCIPRLRFFQYLFIILSQSVIYDWDKSFSKHNKIFNWCTRTLKWMMTRISYPSHLLKNHDKSKSISPPWVIVKCQEPSPKDFLTKVGMKMKRIIFRPLKYKKMFPGSANKICLLRVAKNVEVESRLKSTYWIIKIGPHETKIKSWRFPKCRSWEWK